MTGIQIRNMALICHSFFLIATASFAQTSDQQKTHVYQLRQAILHLDGGQEYVVADIENLCNSVVSQPDDIQAKPPYHKMVYEFAEILKIRSHLRLASSLCWETIRRAKKEKDLEYQMFGHLLLAKIHMEYQHPDSARWHIQLVEQQIGKVNLPMVRALLLNTRADLAANENRLYEALQLYAEILDYFKSTKNPFNVAQVGASMANVYYQLGNHQKAIDLLKEHLSYFEEHKHIPQLMIEYINLGVYYSNVDSQSVAIRNYEKGLKLARKVNDSLTMARLYSNMGNAKRKIREYALARSYQDSALAICRDIQMPYGIFLNHLNRAELFIDQGNWTDALDLLQKAMQMRDFSSHASLRMEILLLFSRAYEGQGDYSNALKYSKLYKNIQDSLEQIQSDERLRQLEAIYEQEKETRKLAAFKEQAAQSTMRNRLMIFILVCALLILIIVLYRIQSRRRVDILQKKLLEEEKERLLVTVQTKNNELLAQALHQASMRELAESLKTELVRFSVLSSKKQKDEIDALIQDIERRIDGDQWNEFESRFAQNHEHFYTTLKRLAPELNASELKICGFLRLNMSSKEISLLTQRTVATIDNNRSVIRKKLNLPADASLSSYLQSLDQSSSNTETA